MSRVLGPIYSSSRLEAAIRDALDRSTGAVGAYLAETVRQAGYGENFHVERPRSVFIAERATRLEEKQLPSLIVVSPGTVGEPRRMGDGDLSCTFSVIVGAVCGATSERVAREKAALIGAAIRSLLLHGMATLDPGVANVRWVGESTDEVPLQTDQRSRAVNGQVFEIDVHQVANTDAGPRPWEFPPDPTDTTGVNLGDEPTVLETTVTVTPVEEIA